MVKDLKLKASASGGKLSPTLLSVPHAISVTADCCGYGTPVLALHYLPVCFEIRMLSENDATARALLQSTPGFTNVKLEASAIEWDMRERRSVDSDLYFGSSPCQDFSSAGCNKGTAGSNGSLWFDQCDRVVTERPRAFVLENVPGLIRKQHRADFESAVAIFKEAGYVVLHKLLTTSQHGIPQKRERVYVLGIRKDSINPQMSLDDIFPPPLKSPVNLPMFLQKEPFPKLEILDETNQCNTFKENLQFATAALGPAALRDFGSLVDIGAGLHKWCGREVAPAITSSRGASSSYYVPHRRQKIHVLELGRLQGWVNDCASDACLPRRLTTMWKQVVSSRFL